MHVMICISNIDKVCDSFMYVCMYVRIYLSVCICMYMYVYLYVYLYVCSVCLSVCLHVCMYVCLFVCLYLRTSVFKKPRQGKPTWLTCFSKVLSGTLLLKCVWIHETRIGWLKAFEPFSTVHLLSKLIRTNVTS